MPHHVIHKFQFHKGTIKTLQDQQAELARQHFNSIKVRLKQESNLIFQTFDFWFQFHKGTIKTVETIYTSQQISSFQFHKGTIKTISVKNTDSVVYISIP